MADTTPAVFRTEWWRYEQSIQRLRHLEKELETAYDDIESARKHLHENLGIRATPDLSEPLTAAFAAIERSRSRNSRDEEEERLFMALENLDD